jgi:proteasome beta subunit
MNSPGTRPGGPESARATGTGDFTELLRLSGNGPATAEAFRASSSHALTNAAAPQTEATTVLSFHYKDGVLIAGDRRATAGNIIMYDRADKVIELDLDTIIAIAGSPAVAFEMARTLQTSFQYYRRSQLQTLSLGAKVRALGKLIKDNLPMTLQGVGAVVPILAARDPHYQPEPSLYFYDALGAQFQAVDFAVSGSGSPAARSVLQWINRWSGQPTSQRDEKQAVQLALQLLDVAAESDSATGGVDRRSHIFPQVKFLTRDGLRSVSVETLRECFTALEAAQK